MFGFIVTHRELVGYVCAGRLRRRKRNPYRIDRRSGRMRKASRVCRLVNSSIKALRRVALWVKHGTRSHALKQ